MTENDRFPGAGDPEAAGRTIAGRYPVLDRYFLRTDPSAPEDIEEAAELIATHQATEGIEDALSICTDLSVALPNPTTVLAEMISTDHEAIPKRWRGGEDMKMVLLMIGYMEVGRLRAQQVAVRRGPDFPGLPERIAEIEGLIAGLNGETL